MPLAAALIGYHTLATDFLASVVMRPATGPTSIDTRLAHGKNDLPFFLQRRIQFREALADDPSSSSAAGAAFSYTQAASKGKRPSAPTDANGFQPASRELFPAERILPLMRWKQITPIGPGLSNLGNTCFLNSVLQCLSYTPPLANYLLSGEHGRKCRIEGFCLICELERHLSIILNPRSDRLRVVQPSGTVSHLKWIAKHMRVGRQEDSHEFLRFMVEGMQRNLLASLADASKLEGRVKETTLVHQIFGGYLQSQVRCLTCQHRSNTFDPFLDLSLDVRQCDSIERALRQFVLPDRLSKANRYRCDHCGKLSDADKSLSIYRAPNVLTIHLKRFNMSPFGEMSKIHKHVDFATELDMSSFVSGGSDSTTDATGTVYDLYAVLVHEGQTCNSGHYHAFVKASNGIWHSMNDSSVNQVSLQTVLKQRAYILFYLRRTGGASEDTCEPKRSAAQSVPSAKTAMVAAELISALPDMPIQDFPSPPATPDPLALSPSPKNRDVSTEDVVKSGNAARQETPKEEAQVISNSMWHLTDSNSFRLEDFSHLYHRWFPSSRWIVQLLLPSPPK